MRKYKDMGGAERYQWAAMIATSVVGFHFFGRMFDGLSMAEQSAGGLLGVYLRVIIMLIVLHVVIFAIFAVKRSKLAQGGDPGEPYERDERDMQIERKADRFAFWFLAVLVEIVILAALFENAYPDNYTFPVSVLSASGLLFALMGGSLLADFFKRIIMIRAYRA